MSSKQSSVKWMLGYLYLSINRRLVPSRCCVLLGSDSRYSSGHSRGSWFLRIRRTSRRASCWQGFGRGGRCRAGEGIVEGRKTGAGAGKKPSRFSALAWSWVDLLNTFELRKLFSNQVGAQKHSPISSLE